MIANLTISSDINFFRNSLLHIQGCLIARKLVQGGSQSFFCLPSYSFFGVSVVEDTLFFLLTLGLVGAILISPKVHKLGRKLISRVSQGQRTEEVPIRAQGRPFDMARVHACA